MGGTIALPDSEEVEVRIRLSTSVRVEERDVLNAWRSKSVRRLDWVRLLVAKKGTPYLGLFLVGGCPHLLAYERVV